MCKCGIFSLFYFMSLLDIILIYGATCQRNILTDFHKKVKVRCNKEITSINFLRVLKKCYCDNITLAKRPLVNPK